MTRFENATKDLVEKFIKQWLVEEEYEIQPHTDPDTSFNYKIIKSNIQLHVGQHNKSKDNIMIKGVIAFKEDEQAMLRYLKTKRELLYDLEIIFTLANIEFSVKPNVTTEEFTIEDIQLTKIIYYDGLTKQTFYDALLSIFNCLKLLISKFILVGRTSMT
jgi:hypothetical protein